jgi:hypothetical protein
VSVLAVAGLLGAVSAWLLSPAGPRQLQIRIWGVLWPLVGIALTVAQDQHGPPLLVGFAVGALIASGSSSSDWQQLAPAGDQC